MANNRQIGRGAPPRRFPFQVSAPLFGVVLSLCVALPAAAEPLPPMPLLNLAGTDGAEVWTRGACRLELGRAVAAPHDDATGEVPGEAQHVAAAATERPIERDAAYYGGADGALRLEYAFSSERRAQCGVRIPLGGFDASSYDHLSLWYRTASDDDAPAAFRVAFMKPHETRTELTKLGSQHVEDVDRAWRRALIPLNRMTGISDWRDLKQFVVIVDSRRGAGTEGSLVLDRIALVHTGDPGPSAYDRVLPPKKKAWERAHGGEQAARALLHLRLDGWPQTAAVASADLPERPRAFLQRLAADTWAGLDALKDRANGVPIDTVVLRSGSADPASARIGDYTTPTNIGLYLAATVAAREFGFISDQGAEERVRRVLDTLERLETYRGFFYNFYDTTTLERSSNFISSVDSSWLTAGLMVVRRAMPAFAQRASALIDGADYGWFYDDVEDLLYHGYYVNLDTMSEYHYGLLYTEARLLSLIAIGKGEVPRRHWFKLSRTFPDTFAWQSQTPQLRRQKRMHGVDVAAGWYEYAGEKYVPSWGGSMFEALMPTLFLDEAEHAPRSLGRNNEVHTEMQRQHAVRALDYPVWGMSPSATTQGDGYGEFGVPFLGVLGYGPGVVTPHASALALGVAPDAAERNLLRLSRIEGAYGPYGFYDALDPLSGRVAPKYLTLDQSMIFLALANHMLDGVVRDYFTADPIAQSVLPLIGEEAFFE
jgi:hypothetical protein